MHAVVSCYEPLKGMSSGYLSHQLNALQLNFECWWNGFLVLWQKVSEWSPIFLLPLEWSQDYWKQFVFFQKNKTVFTGLGKITWQQSYGLREIKSLIQN